MKRLLPLFLTFFSILFLFFISANQVAAQTLDCSKLNGKPGLHGQPEGFTTNPNAIYNGNHCSDPGGKIDTVCIGSCRYIVTWCDDFGIPGEGCVETYDEENCSSAPAVCNKPNDLPQSEIGKVFGQIIPPRAIQNFGPGATGISKFLSNTVTLIFTVATIVFVFMILWGAFEWMMSAGDKEKISSSQKRIINAIIGMILFALAFAIIRIFGTFTGFTFFK